MRPHLPRPADSHQAVASGAAAERSLAEMWLGAGHPLVQSLSRSETACRQLVTVTAAGAAGVVWYVGDWSFGLSLAMTAAVVQVGLACRLAVLGHGRRDLCLGLIVHGCERVPVPCIERLRLDLVDRRARERLASSIDELVCAAVPCGSRSQLIRPLADRRVIRAVAPELREVASLLRGDPAVQGVALVEWLLTSPATPLYGSELEPLRAQLRRARYLMSPG
jgi:hypothetical protein